VFCKRCIPKKWELPDFLALQINDLNPQKSLETPQESR